MNDLREFKNLNFNEISGEEFHKKIREVSDNLSHLEKNYEKFLDDTIRENIDVLTNNFRENIIDKAFEGCTSYAVFFRKNTAFDVKLKRFISAENNPFSFNNFLFINAYSIVRQLFPKPFIVNFRHEKAVEKVFLKISW